MIVRVNKNDNYTVMSNKHLRDKDLSLKAKGLLSVVLSLPEDWDYSISGLVSICKESETSVKSALDELKEHGYLIITKKMPNETKTGRYEYIYDFYEDPQKQEGKKQGVEIQPLEILPIENQAVENLPLNKYTEELSTDKQSKEILSKEGICIEPFEKKPKNTRFVPPTLGEVQSYCWERHNNVDAQKFIDHYSSNGWKVGRNPMKDWKAAVRTWERSQYDKPKFNEYFENPFTKILKEEGYT